MYFYFKVCTVYFNFVEVGYVLLAIVASEPFPNNSYVVFKIITFIMEIRSLIIYVFELFSSN